MGIARFLLRLNTFRRTPECRGVLTVVAIGFVIRLGWAIWAMRSAPTILGDQYSYWYYGTEIAHGRGYISYTTGTATAYYPIGFPALLGVVYWFGLHTPLPDNAAQLTALTNVLFSTASIALVYLIARRCFSHRVGLLAAWITALYPGLVLGTATFHLETVYIFTALLAVAIVVDHSWTTGPMSRTRLIWFALALAASALIRPFSLPILLALAVAVWCSGLGWRSVVRHVSWVLLPLVLLLVPWTARNEARFHHVIPFSTNLGDGLCMSRFPGSNGGFSWTDHAWCVDPNMPDAQRNVANTKMAIKFVLHHPGEELRQIPKRLALMMGNDRDMLLAFEDNGSNLRMVSPVRTAVKYTADWYFHLSWLLTLGGVGLLCRGWRDDRITGPRRAIVGTTMLSLFILPIGLWGNPRFHMPLLPFFAIGAAASISWMFDRYRSAPSPEESPSSDRGQDSEVPAGAMNTAVG